ncbi:MAG TPA: hypothetical protein DEB24_02800 [Coriobacteriia bacterium]|nr:hypothetical protein [Coriobacteriia bacterium]
MRRLLASTKPFALIVALTLAFLLAPPIPALAATTTVTELTNAGVQMDGQQVVVEGEVIGDIIYADVGHKWLMLSDGNASISVLTKNADAQKIVYLGRYNQVGTRVEISGVFRVDDTTRDGLTDVTAQSIKILDEGYAVQSPVDWQKIQIGALLLVVGGIVIFIHWRLKERTR